MNENSTEQSMPGSAKPESRKNQRRIKGGSSRFSTWMRSIWRRRWFSLICAWTICLGGWTAVALWPNNYMSSAVLYADLSRLAEQKAFGNNIASGRLAEEGPASLLKRMLLGDESPAALRDKTDLDGDLFDTLSQHVMIRATAPTLFVATYYHRDPEVAHQVLDKLFSSLTNHLDEAVSEETQNLQQEITDLEGKLEDASTNLANFRQGNADFFEKPDSTAADIETLEEDVIDLKQRIERAIIERDEVAEELAQLPLSQEAAREPTPAPLASENQVAELAALETKLAELRERYADTHPYVSTVINAIEALNVETGIDGQSAEQNAAVIDAAGEDSEQLADLKQRHEEKIADLSELNNDLANKEREIDRLKVLTDSTSSVEAEQSRLETEKSDLEGALAKLVIHRETLQSRTDGDAAQQDETAEQTSFRLINEPSLPDKPTGLSRMLCLVLVLLGGVGVSGGIAVLRNRSKGVFESAWQLKQRFDVGVLGTISEVLSPVERKQLGYARLAFSLGCFGLVGIFSGLAIAEFLNLLTPWGDSLRTQLLG